MCPKDNDPEDGAIDPATKAMLAAQIVHRQIEDAKKQLATFSRITGKMRSVKDARIAQESLNIALLSIEKATKFWSEAVEAAEENGEV